MSIGARLIVVALLVSVPATAQQKKWRSPWGDPDLQGSWSNATTTPLQRPAKYAGREFLTPQERAEQDKETAIGTDKRSARGWSDGRTSLIYDPPDGRIPALTPEARQRQASRNEAVRTDGPYEGPEDLDL